MDAVSDTVNRSNDEFADTLSHVRRITIPKLKNRLAQIGQQNVSVFGTSI